VSDLNEQEQWERVKEFVRANGIWMVVGVILGGSGFAAYRWNEARKVTQAETAAARFDELMVAQERGDKTRVLSIVEELNRDHDDTPYADFANLTAARAHVENNELDKAAASLNAVMQKTSDAEIALIARMRLARVQAAQGKFDDALATLNVTDTGEFATRFADVRGDVLFAKGDKPGALKEYLAARAGKPDGLDVETLDLKIRDLGGTPPPTAAEFAPQIVTGES
jgi:predicted negative regulator of RcsB-dependent stress response